MAAGIATQSQTTTLPDLSMLGRIRLSDTPDSDGVYRTWVMLLPEGKWETQKYPTLDFRHAILAEIKRNFDAGARGIEIALDYDHKASEGDSRAPGWLEQVELRGPQPDGTPAGLWGLVGWTALGLSDVKQRIYRYISAEYAPTYHNDFTDKDYKHVLIGVTLTNRPVMKNMPAIVLADGKVSRRAWGSVDKSKLPRSCFLMQGDPGKKDTWKLPVYEGAGDIGADGMYSKRGPLNINGVRAALDAVGGARTGKAMNVPAGVRSRLERWMRQYGADASETKQASERGVVRSARNAMGKVTGKVTQKTRDERDQRELEGADDEDELLLADSDEEDLDEQDETEEFDEEADDGVESFADGEDDGEAYDEADGDGAGYDKMSDRHGAMTCDEHSHGKYGAHGHDGDGDHSDAPLKNDADDDDDDMSEKRGGSGKKKMGERRTQTTQTRAHRHAGEQLTLAEARKALAELETLREEHTQMRFKLYETETEKRIDAWRNQTFLFREGSKGGKPVQKNGRIAISKAFADRYRAFMLGEGIRLSEGQRGKLNALIESALSSAVVDLSQRAPGSYDQETRKTIARGGDRQPGGAAESDRLEDEANKLCLAEEGKPLSEVDSPKQLRFYERAAKEIGYR